MNILAILIKLVGSTPFWVWVVLVILIKRGLALKNDGEVSLAKSSIMPLIFIVWGLEKVFNSFSYPFYALLVYLILLAIGATAGKILYRNKQKFYTKNGQLIRKGTSLPLVIILVNFGIKYFLNVYMSVLPVVLTQLNFNLVYGLIAGFTVGLFIGGLWNTLKNKQLLEERNELV